MIVCVTMCDCVCEIVYDCDCVRLCDCVCDCV